MTYRALQRAFGYAWRSDQCGLLHINPLAGYLLTSEKNRKAHKDAPGPARMVLL